MMIGKQPGVYEIVSPEGKRYIGSSIDVRHRWRGHLSDIRKKKHHSKLLQEAADRFGVDRLQFNVLAICRKSNLLFIEQSAIAIFNPEYNTTTRADCPMRDPESVARLRATIGTDAAKAKRSEISRMQWQKAEYREKYERAMAEVRKTSEYKERASIAQKKRRAQPHEIEKYKAITSSIEYRQKQSDRSKDANGRREIIEFRNSEEFKTSHRASVVEALARPEVKIKASEARKKLWADPEFREKRIKNIREYTSTPEYKLKMSIAVKSAKEKKKNGNSN